MWEWPTQLIEMKSKAYVKCLLGFCLSLLVLMMLPNKAAAADCDFQQFATPEGLYYNSEIDCEVAEDGDEPYDPPMCESEVEGACVCSTVYTVGFRRERCVEPASYSSYDNPTVRLSYYVSGFGVRERYLGIGDCAGPHIVRHCARLAPHVGSARFAPTIEERDELEAIYTKYGNTIEPEKLRLCVYEDAWDLTDTKFSYSPFHHNTGIEEAGRVMAMINKTHSNVGDAATNGPGAFDSIVASLVTDAYNYDVAGVVGCAPVPLAPFPPKFCDECEVTRPSPDPSFDFASNATFAEPTITVTSYTVDYAIPIGIGGASTSVVLTLPPVSLALDTCDPTGTYCSKLHANGRNVCLEMNTTEYQNRIVHCKPRPDFMPLPVVSKDYNSADPLAMKVSLSSGGKTEEKTLYVSDPDAQCSDFMGVELCANRPCVEFNHTTRQCTTFGTDVCLQGYEPTRFDVEGYHPSKGVVANQSSSGVTQEPIVQSLPNSFDDGKYYYDFPTDEASRASKSIASNQVHRAFSEQELGLCITSPSMFITPGQSEYIVPDKCTMIEVQVWGAGGAGRQIGGASSAFGNALQRDHSGGGGGFAKARIPVTSGDRFYTQTGRGGQAVGEEGGRSYFSRNRTTHDIRANGGGNNVDGSGAPWDRSAYVTNSHLRGSVAAEGIPGMNVIELNNGTAGYGVTSNISGILGFSKCRSGGASGGNAGMSVGSCRTTQGAMIAANSSTYGAGGCACDDWVGAWGQGSHGAVVVDCVAFENELGGEGGTSGIQTTGPGSIGGSVGKPDDSIVKPGGVIGGGAIGAPILLPR